MDSLIIIICVAEGLVSILSAVLCCRAVCCYKPNEVHVCAYLHGKV